MYKYVYEEGNEDAGGQEAFRFNVEPQTNNKCTSHNNLFILNDRLEIRTKQSTQPVSINCQVHITWLVIYVCYTLYRYIYYILHLCFLNIAIAFLLISL